MTLTEKISHWFIDHVSFADEVYREAVRGEIDHSLTEAKLYYRSGHDGCSFCYEEGGFGVEVKTFSATKKTKKGKPRIHMSSWTVELTPGMGIAEFIEEVSTYELRGDGS